MLPGISGSLLPTRFLADCSARGLLVGTDASAMETRRRHLLAWWQRVEATCGPATGLRAIFDLVAMPLAAQLGFRARDAEFGQKRATAWLRTRRGSAVGLVIRPWADRPSQAWRDVADSAQSIGADWCLLVAPPFVSLVDARGCALRRSLDFRLPDALETRSFGAFFMLLRAEAFDAAPLGTTVSRSPLDRLVLDAARYADRVRDDLQRGVVEALSALGPVLERSRPLLPSRFDEALTLVYRVLFLLFAESRGLLPRDRPVYESAYTVSALCRDALDDPRHHTGLWESLAAITRLARRGCDSRHLIVRPFNGRLFARATAPSLEAGRRPRRPSLTSTPRDQAMARTLLSLGTRPGRAGREPITYADLGVEQLGAVYERVLDLDPVLVLSGKSGTADRPHRASRRHSRQRKETGTFYTPQPLAEFLVRRTLAPLVRGASSDQILDLRVVDPAMGSGAFLVAACRYLARAYEQALVDEGRAPDADFGPDERADIRRLVAERCLAGVDANPVAVQLARLSLWLTTLARDKPLGFMDHRLRHGNSLVGASPDDLWRSGPARATAALPLFEAADLEATMREVAAPFRRLRLDRETTVADIHRKESAWAALTGNRSPLAAWRLACHLWCARWFWKEGATEHRPPSPNELRATLDALLKHDRVLDRGRVDRWTRAAADLASQHGFFHWPLEFADVFHDDLGQPRSRAGFDAVIGNPPWEVVRGDPSLVRFLRESGLYPSCGRGHVNLYQPFVERALSLTRAGGRVGLLLPWGLAVDDGAARLRERLFEHGVVDTIVGCDNGAGVFPIHRGFRFVALVASPGGAAKDTRALFGARTMEEFDALPGTDEPGERSAFPLRLTRQMLVRIGGPALRIPDLRRPTDLAWMERLTRNFPALGGRDGWGARFGRELNATEDRKYFGDGGLPVLEGKHIAPFAADVAASTARLPAAAARRLLRDRRFDRPRLAYRDVSAAGNRRALIAAILPGGVVTTHTLFCLRDDLPIAQQHFLCGLFNSHVLNAFVRLLMGSHVTTSLVEQLPVPVWRAAPSQRLVARLAERLAQHPDSRRARVHLQAAVAALYGFDADGVRAVLDANPGLPADEREGILARVRLL